MTGPTTHISKLAAAQRQVDAAIRMILADEDDLAIVTVAAAGFRVLRDLKSARGESALGDEWRNAMIGWVIQEARGELPRATLESLPPEVREGVLALAETARKVGADDQKMRELLMSVPPYRPKGEKEYWTRVHKSAAFLKHADKDAAEVLAETDLNPIELIFRASLLYADLTGTFSIDMQVWLMYEFCIRNNVPPPSDGLMNWIYRQLAAADPTDVKSKARLLVVTLKQPPLYS